MYRGASEVWRGLAKNATEGIATPGMIVPATVLLLGGQVLPFGLLGSYEAVDESEKCRPGLAPVEGDYSFFFPKKPPKEPPKEDFPSSERC